MKSLSERHAANLAAARKAARFSPEQLAKVAWPDVPSRPTGGQRVRGIESGRNSLTSPFADELAAALGLDVSFFGQRVSGGE